MKKIKNHSDVVIVGAGLAGLSAAYFLEKEGIKDVTVLEARNRIGGRILTENSVDLGATWFGVEHTEIINLLTNLNIDTYKNYKEGNNIAIYSSMAPPLVFKPHVSYLPGYRVKGGTEVVVNALALQSNCNVLLGRQVDEIVKGNDKPIEIKTNSGVFTCKKVIVTVPPKLAHRINYKPKMSLELSVAMQESHTWMENAIKFAFTFKEPFWRAKGFSGTVHGHAGIVKEVYDHCNEEASVFILKGFANESLRLYTKGERKEKLKEHLVKLFGTEIANYTAYVEKDWSDDNFTASLHFKSLYASPKRDVTSFQPSYWENSLFFAGAETAVTHAGYMDGAVQSSLRVVKQLLST